MDGRLAGRIRGAKAQRVQNPAQRDRIPEPHAKCERRNKKSPRLGSVCKLAEAWGKTQLPNGRRVAQRFARAAAGLTLDTLTQDTANQMLQEWRSGGHFSKSSTRIYRGYLHRLLKHLVDCGANPRCEKMLAKVPNYGPRKIIAEGDEGTRLLAAAAKKPWLAALLTIIMGHGLRISEARRLARCHYNAHAGTITFPTKHQGENTLPASKELAELFRTAPPSVLSTDPLISLIARSPIARATIYKEWRKLKTAAGVNPDLWFHDLRRTIAVHTMDATRDMRVVQALLGHKNLATTALYLEHVDAEKMRKTLREVMPLGLRKKLEERGAYFGPTTYQN